MKTSRPAILRKAGFLAAKLITMTTHELIKQTKIRIESLRHDLESRPDGQGETGVMLKELYDDMDNSELEYFTEILKHLQK